MWHLQAPESSYCGGHEIWSRNNIQRLRKMWSTWTLELQIYMITIWFHSSKFIRWVRGKMYLVPDMEPSFVAVTASVASYLIILQLVVLWRSTHFTRVCWLASLEWYQRFSTCIRFTSGARLFQWLEISLTHRHAWMFLTSSGRFLITSRKNGFNIDITGSRIVIHSHSDEVMINSPERVSPWRI